MIYVVYNYGNVYNLFSTLEKAKEAVVFLRTRYDIDENSPIIIKDDYYDDYHNKIFIVEEEEECCSAICEANKIDIIY